MYSSIEEFILLREPEGVTDFRKEDIYRFSGPRSMIASALVFRLMKEAIRDLCSHEIPERRAFTVVSGHAGPGVRDGFEYLTRAASDGRYIFDPSNPPLEAQPSAAGGFMFFKIGYKNRAMLYVLSEELFGEEWFRQVNHHQEGSVSETAHTHYLAYKAELCGKILYSPEIFSVRKPCSIEVEPKKT